MNIEFLVYIGRQALAAKEAQREQEAREREMRDRQRAEEWFQRWKEKHKGVEAQLIEINDAPYALIWGDNDPAVVADDRQFYLLTWECNWDNLTIEQIVVNPRRADPSILEEVLAEAADMPPTKPDAENALQKARMLAAKREKDDQRGWCPFTKEKCDGMICQLWDTVAEDCAFKSYPYILKGLAK